MNKIRINQQKQIEPQRTQRTLGYSYELSLSIEPTFRRITQE